MPKPGSKKKPFIDKKNAVKFQLIHRSQRDPEAANEDAPQMVLHPLNKVKEEEREHGVFYDDDYNYLQHLKDRSAVEHDWEDADRFILERKHADAGGCCGSKPLPAPRVLERKNTQGGGGGCCGGNRAPPLAAGAGSRCTSSLGGTQQAVEGLRLPSVVFATQGEEEEVGLLNKAAPRGLDLSLDPDIVAAMDEDFDFDDPDNKLDDDFISLAMGEGGPVSGEEGSDFEDGEDEGAGSDQDWETDSDCMGGRSDDEDEDDEVPELQPFEEEETKTRFTNYSMSSSVIRRNKELSLLDDKFERFMDQYGEFEEGALDGEDIEGTLDSEGTRMEQLIQEADQERRTARQNIEREKEASRRLATLMEEKECDEFEPIQIETVDPEEKWDCESILSTYSNKFNHPKLISERKIQDPIQLSSKTGIPKNTLGRGLTAAALRQLDIENNTPIIDDDVGSVASRVSALSVRPKHETIEEKRARKQALKEFRRERRIERKANTSAFKDEQKRQEKILQNKNNLQGNKIM